MVNKVVIDSILTIYISNAIIKIDHNGQQGGVDYGKRQHEH